ncbi:SDR family oxidoreductase [Pelagicoccus sp. SDUM812003]|uniref:SDR family NAD(P)-dependent oxidoreductase n=1 Tax=Pelagicoccus sp. SDUM812003 TaxID=3041267 RepID=UPI00280D8058|nr:SDR family oxidoreductase [Pelagicoccus sp. SDUM812003]MDQ8202148.1 SDR family NAD(P)-dependent oxidoreductase [Pelagicoccus sp. SDUM812003]
MILAGQKALVTGASRGVGREIAKAFAREGIQVFGTSRDPDGVDWPEGVVPVKMDASSPESLERDWRAADLSGRGLSIVVNNAGSGALGAFETVAFCHWEAQVKLMLLAPMKLCHLALEGWSRENPGALVNVTSLAVEYPIPFMSGYNAAKAGLAGFTDSLFNELDPEVARVLELRLGDLNTRFNDHVDRLGGGGFVDTVWKAMEKHVDTAPPADLAARKLLKALKGNRSGLVRAGSLFQCAFASLFGKFVSSSVKRASNLRYYNVERS